MSDDEVLTALEAFIAGFGVTDRNTQEPRSPNSKGEALIDKGSQKETGEREKERGSREVPYVQNLGTLGSNTKKPGHSRAFRQSPRGAHEALQAEMRWHLDHGERVSGGLCAGCRRPFVSGGAALELADGNRVHLEDGYGCLIGWGTRWRAFARVAVSETADKGAGRPQILPREAQQHALVSVRCRARSVR